MVWDSETPTNAPGGLLEIRYLIKPLVGVEMSYEFNKMDSTFAYNKATCPVVCLTSAATPTTSLSIKENNLALDYVASAKFGKLRAFGLGGVGFNITAPRPSLYGTHEVIRAAFNAGGGVEWDFLSHFGFRAQVRDYFVKAQNNSLLYPATGVTTQTIEPMGGIYYRF